MARVTEEQVLESLGDVIDPASGKDIVSAGMISGLVVKDGNVGFAIEVDPQRGAEMNRMLPGTAADLKHRAAVGEHLDEPRQDRLAVLLARGTERLGRVQSRLPGGNGGDCPASAAAPPALMPPGRGCGKMRAARSAPSQFSRR